MSRLDESRCAMIAELPAPLRTIADIRTRLRESAFYYIALRRAEHLHAIATGLMGYVHVIGHPEIGAYEWLCCTCASAPDPARPDEPARFLVTASNCGYGSGATALRDGLNHALD